MTTTPIISYSHTGANRLTVDLLKLIASKLLVQAASGGGKSWAIRQLCEELHGKVPQIIIDPEGEFHTLRERHDYVLAAVRGGDIEASVKTAPILARRFVELSASAVIDLSEMKPDQQRAFVRKFLETMLGLPRELWHPTLTVIDEFHIYAPESGHGEAESLAACSDFSTRARKRGFCLVGATTRIAKLHKDVVGNLHNKMIGFNSLDVDIDRAAKELGFSKERRETIRRLDPGQFYVYGPAISKEVTLIQTGPVKTTHPEPGMSVAVAAVPPSRKVKALIASSLADLPQEAEEEARTVEELKRANAELNRQLKAKPPAVTSGADIEKAVARETGKILRDCNAQLDRLRAEDAKQIQQLKRLVDKFAGASRNLVSMSEDMEHIVEMKLTRPEGQTLPASASPVRPVAVQREPSMDKSRTVPVPARREVREGLTGVQQKIVDAIARLNDLGVEHPDKVVVAALAGYGNLTSKGFANAIGALRSAGYIIYPAEGKICLSADGTPMANHDDPIESLDELHGRVFSIIGGAAEKILRPILEAYPDAIDTEAVAAAAGYTNLTSKGFANAKGRLRTLGFIDYPATGKIKATDLLFPSGL